MASLLEHTVMPSGGDYTSLDAAIDHLVASHANLVTADVYAEVKIDGTWSSADTAAVTINGLTTDATRYLLVYAATAARHAGVWSTGKYNLTYTATANYEACIQGYDEFVRIDGLQIKMIAGSYTGTKAIAVNPAATSDVRLSNTIICGNPSIAAKLESGVGYLWNDIIYTTGDYGLYSDATTSSVYSCTLVGTVFGIRNVSGTMTAKNCYAKGTADYAYYGTITKTTCASSDTTDSVGLQNIAYNTDAFINVTAGSEDLHLAADGLSPLQGAGTDTSGDAAPMNFTTDIDGDTRS